MILLLILFSLYRQLITLLENKVHSLNEREMEIIIIIMYVQCYYQIIFYHSLINYFC